MSGTATCGAMALAGTIITSLCSYIAAVDTWCSRENARTSRPDPDALIIAERVHRRLQVDAACESSESLNAACIRSPRAGLPVPSPSDLERAIGRAVFGEREASNYLW